VAVEIYFGDEAMAGQPLLAASTYSRKRRSLSRSAEWSSERDALETSSVSRSTTVYEVLLNPVAVSYLREQAS